MNKFYLLTGSVFSFVYIGIGMLLLSGKLTFGIESRHLQILFGSGMAAYGIFRVYMFYMRARNSGNDGTN